MEVAQSFEDVTRFLELNQDDTVALLFIDSTLSEQAGNGFFSGVVSSITHIFSGAEEPNASHQRVAEIEKEISDETALIQIDVSNENLREIQESYDVTTVPFLIVTKRGIVVLKEVPTHETHDKILQVLNVNPAAVSEDGNSGETNPEVPVSTIVEDGGSGVQPVSFAEIPAEEVAVPEETVVEESIPVEEPVVVEESVPEVEDTTPVVEETTPAVEEVVVEEVQPEPIPEVIPEEAPEDDVILINDDLTLDIDTSSQETPAEVPDILEPGKIFVTEIDPNDHSDVPRSFELPPRPVAAPEPEIINLDQPIEEPAAKPVAEPETQPEIKLKATPEPIIVPPKITLAPGEDAETVLNITQPSINITQPIVNITKPVVNITKPVVITPPPSVKPVVVKPQVEIPPVPTPTPAPVPHSQHPIIEENPGQVVERPAAPQPAHEDPDDRKKYVYHHCDHRDSYDNCISLDWRHTSGYIPELEDYEIPEDWWRSGYTPVEGANPADEWTKEQREQCAIPHPPPKVVYEPPVSVLRKPEPIVHEAPVVRQPVRPIELIPEVHAPRVNVTQRPLNVTQRPIVAPRPQVIAPRVPVAVNATNATIAFPEFVPRRPLPGLVQTKLNRTVVQPEIKVPVAPKVNRTEVVRPTVIRPEHRAEVKPVKINAPVRKPAPVIAKPQVNTTVTRKPVVNATSSVKPAPKCTIAPHANTAAVTKPVSLTIPNPRPTIGAYSNKTEETCSITSTSVHEVTNQTVGRAIPEYIYQQPFLRAQSPYYRAPYQQVVSTPSFYNRQPQVIAPQVVNTTQSVTSTPIRIKQNVTTTVTNTSQAPVVAQNTTKAANTTSVVNATKTVSTAQTNSGLLSSYLNRPQTVVPAYSSAYARPSYQYIPRQSYPVRAPQYVAPSFATPVIVNQTAANATEARPKFPTYSSSTNKTNETGEIKFETNSNNATAQNTTTTTQTSILQNRISHRTPFGGRINTVRTIPTVEVPVLVEETFNITTASGENITLTEEVLEFAPVSATSRYNRLPVSGAIEYPTHEYVSRQAPHVAVTNPYVRAPVTSTVSNTTAQSTNTTSRTFPKYQSQNNSTNAVNATVTSQPAVVASPIRQAFSTHHTPVIQSTHIPTVTNATAGSAPLLSVNSTTPLRSTTKKDLHAPQTRVSSVSPTAVPATSYPSLSRFPTYSGSVATSGVVSSRLGSATQPSRIQSSSRTFPSYTRS